MGPHPAVAEVRLAVRRALRELVPDPAEGAVQAGSPWPGNLVLAACSGGADSLALAAALAFEAPKVGLRAGGIVIDHGLQPGSAEVAAKVTGVIAGLGLEPALSVAVSVARPGAARAAGSSRRSAAFSASTSR